MEADTGVMATIQGSLEPPAAGRGWKDPSLATGVNIWVMLMSLCECPVIVLSHHKCSDINRIYQES